MPGILDLPTEIFDLILDETELFTLSPRDRYSNIYKYEFRNGLKIARACRQFYKVVLPRLYSTCHVNFKETKDGYFAFHTPIRTTPAKYHAYQQHGCFVRNLFITTWGSCFYEPDYSTSVVKQCYRSVPQLLGELLPSFKKLRLVSLDRRPNIPLKDFVDGIRIVMSTCTALKTLELSIDYVAVDDAQALSLAKETGDWPAGTSAVARPNEMRIYLQESIKGGRSEPVRLWLMELLGRLLGGAASAEVKTLKFSHDVVQNSMTRSQRRRIGWLRNFTAGEWAFPGVEKVEMGMGRGTMWAVDEFLSVGFAGVREVSLSQLRYLEYPDEEEVTVLLEFLDRCTSMKVLQLLSPESTECLEAVLRARRQFRTLKEVRVVLPRDDRLGGDIMEDFAEDYRGEMLVDGSRDGDDTVVLRLD
ncbi:hypothetical protein DRE_02719 [Drechslerella stenobrocha 248]|uniref:F-box domain-containing protein n=1 Tax=Drechslerella stenobrocha 248 TaxID=1043628 RepID=W7IG48_9PEZI|nr:hypothetical protein DRE_02719 [Drechslerella stenobrocha 248]